MIVYIIQTREKIIGVYKDKYQAEMAWERYGIENARDYDDDMKRAGFFPAEVIE